MVEAKSQSKIWQALDHLRGEPPAHDIPVTLAALLYLRWADFQEAEQEAIAAFDEDDYEPILPASMHWRTWHLLEPNEMWSFLTKRLPKALNALGNSRHNSLATQLHRIVPAVETVGRLSPRGLYAIVHWLAEQAFETPGDHRAMLDTLDEVLMKSVGKHSGEHRTPDAITRFIAELAAPVEGDRIYDPCFGSAGLLTAACDHVRKLEGDRFTRSGVAALSVSGVEINQNAYVIGLSRLSLAGINDPQLELGNSLERTASNNPERDGFDVVLANPPWGMRVDTSGLDHFPVKTTEATGLFIQHALSQLRPEGRAVIVVPQGFLFRGGAEQRLRRLLLEKHSVETVISLPDSTFLPYTSIGSSILVLRRKGPTKRIRMVDAEPFFEKTKGREPVKLRQGLVACAQSPKPDKYSWDVEAKTLGKIEWDFTPKRRDRSGLSQILDSLGDAAEVRPLKDCCTIMSGRSYKGDQLLDSPPPQFKERTEEASLFPDSDIDAKQSSLFDVPHIPYIRIRDIQQGQASKGSSWLSPEAAATVDARLKLKNGDVLLSKSGTIGKVGVIRNGAVGGVAANGLFLLRPDQEKLDPHFLYAYLDSSECREWLNDRARGATIRHLSKRILDEMPVPIPALQIQQRVAAQHRDHGVDALSMIAQLLTEAEGNPISDWVIGALRFLKSEEGSSFKQHDIASLLNSHVLGGGFIGMRNSVAHGKAESSLSQWVMAVGEGTEVLRGAGDIPAGPALYSLLQKVSHRFSSAASSISGHLPNESKARDLTTILKDRVDQVMAYIANKIDVVISCNTNRLKPGQFSEIDLVVENSGLLPLRDLAVKTEADWGSEKIGFLAEGATKTIMVSGITPKGLDTFSLRVSWTARAFDGRMIDGAVELAFDLIESKATSEEMKADFGGSPYVCGDPIRPERNDVFFGREDLLEQIRRQITEAGNVVLLEGNRRSGKSSVLWHLAGIEGVPGWLSVYCSLQGAEGSKEGVGVPTAGVFREIAISIAKSVQRLDGDTPLPNGQVLPPGKKLGITKACREGIGENSAFSDFRDYFEAILELLENQNLGLLLMLDEFDKLQEGIDSGVTSPQVPENIRYLVQTYPRFSAILTGSRRLKRLREEYWSALYGLGTRFGVTSLPDEPARKLITEPVKGRMTYSREATDRAIFLTAGQPYLLQCLCNRIFDMAAQLKAGSISIDMVNRAGDALVKDNEHFASLWDYAWSDRRRLILALCHKESVNNETLSLGVLRELLFKEGLVVDEEALVSDLEFLRELEVIGLIGESGGGHYALSIPLMGTWIEQHQDFEAVLSKARAETEDQHE